MIGPTSLNYSLHFFSIEKNTSDGYERFSSGLPYLLQLYTRLYLSDHRKFWNTERWKPLINIFASNNCLSERNIFQNGVDILSKIDEAFLAKS